MPLCIDNWASDVGEILIYLLSECKRRILEGVPMKTHCKPIFLKQQILPLPCTFILETILHIHCGLGGYDTHTVVHNFDTRNIVVPRSRIKTTCNNKLNVKIYNCFISTVRNANVKNKKKLQMYGLYLKLSISSMVWDPLTLLLSLLCFL